MHVGLENWVISWTAEKKKRRRIVAFVHIWRRVCGVEVLPHLIFNLDTRWGVWSPLSLGCTILRERAPGSHWIGDWVSPRFSLDTLEKRQISCISHSMDFRPIAWPLYGLHYPGSKLNSKCLNFLILVFEWFL